jgi:single-strand DNA-binding protein
MASYNKVIMIGRLTRDPEAKIVSGDNAVCKWSIAVNEKYRTKAGEERENVCFVDCVAWRRTGEVVAKYVHKGDELMIDGKLKQDTWEADDGSKRSKLYVEVERVQLMGQGKQSDAQQAPATAPAASSAPAPASGDDGTPLPF